LEVFGIDFLESGHSETTRRQVGRQLFTIDKKRVVIIADKDTKNDANKLRLTSSFYS